MAKKKKIKNAQRKIEKFRQKPLKFSLKKYLNKHPNTLPPLILFVLLLIFFNEVMMGGKTFLPPDRLNSQSIGPFIQDALNRGIYPLWCPYIFSGMPSFSSLTSAPYVDILGDIIKVILWPFKKIFPLPDFMGVFINYFLFGLFTYIFLMKKAGVRIVALFAALAMVFQPPVIAFAAFGHNTKIATAAFIPIIFLLLDELLEKRQLLYFALLALAVGLQLLRAHTQIAYYTFMMMGMFILYWVIGSVLRKHSFKNIVKSLSLVAFALIIGAAMSSWLYLSVQEYTQYSIRGGAKGLDYGYATNWSFSPSEIITFLIPSFMGFGGETYWGGMPFTDYPFYMGIVTLLLAGMAFIVKRSRYVVFFTILALVTLVISFGKHFPILYGPLFKFLPFFNKFRVPSMIHILLAFAVVILAGIGLHSLLNLKDQSQHQKIRKYIYIFIGISGFIALFLLFGKGVYLNWVDGSAKNLTITARDSAYQKAASDAIKLVILLALSGFAILYYLKGKINRRILGGTLISLLIIDLWWVDFKIVHPQPKTDQDRYFANTEVVRFLKRDSERYRIYPVYDDKPSNWYVYHKIQNIQGYHAAKLKIYQTFLEETGLDSRNKYGLPPFLAKYFRVVLKDSRPSLQPIPPEQISPKKIKFDNTILDMLNAKYLISYYPIPDPRYRQVLSRGPYVYENTGVLPRAYFVDKFRVIKGKDNIFNYMKSGDFDPSTEAILENEPEFSISPSEDNQVRLISYDIHEIKLNAQVATPTLMVLSEIFYPAGWKAFVDDKEKEIYKTNYILRSIFLEPGSHEIKFVFNPKSFKLGLWISLLSFLFILSLLVIQLAFIRKKKNSHAEN